MKQRIIFFLINILICSQLSFAQEIYFKAGKNFTTYKYKNAMGMSNPHIFKSQGSNYELGCEFFIDDSNNSLESNYSYAVSLTLNQFNATGGDFNNNYYWNTNYLGIQNALLVSIMNNDQGICNLKLKGGINTATILNGRQSINNTIYDLKNYQEFKGLILQPLFGLDFRLEIWRYVMFSASYYYSYSYNISNKSSEKLNFSTNHIQFGIQYTLY